MNTQGIFRKQKKQTGRVICYNVLLNGQMFQQANCALLLHQIYGTESETCYAVSITALPSFIAFV